MSLLPFRSLQIRDLGVWVSAINVRQLQSITIEERQTFAFNFVDIQLSSRSH